MTSTSDGSAAAGLPTPDQLDKEQLDQLHAATLKASEACFELKKLCATVLVPAGTLVALLSDRTLNPAVMIAGLLVIVAFWLADAFAYYYQRKLRNLMNVIWRRRASRLDDYSAVPLDLENTRLHALFNESMSYYYILLTLVALLFALYTLGVINPIAPGKP